MPGPEDECYRQLREAIMTGAFLPNQRLVEKDLVQTFGFGRVAVRTALARLEQEGAIEREHHRGARVRLVSEAEAIEILETRAVLEGLAARHAARNASPEDIAALRAILVEQRRRIEAGDLLGSSEINARLHQKLLQIANHATVSRLLDVLKIQNVRFQYRTILVPGRPERSFKEHSAIVEAVAAHDAEAAEAAVRTHLSHVCEALRQTRHARNHQLHMQTL